MKRLYMPRLALILCVSGVGGISTQAFASAFQLLEQDGASVANYHAGYAALANDASIAWYNPAGIPRIKNQQLTFGGLGVVTDFKYQGTINVNTLGATKYFPVTAQGGVFTFVPNLHYVAPLTERLGFGFSVDVPFGLKTDYGNSTYLRYAATETSITVVDISPSFGFQITDEFSLGLGLDIQRLYAEFDQVGVVTEPATDTSSTNKAMDTAYGFHAGGLYQFSPNTRVGLSYHSQVVHRPSGNSRFEGPLADAFGGTFTSHASTKITLPAYTALSVYHQLQSPFAVMGSVIFTQWSVFQHLIFNNLSGIKFADKSQTITATIPEGYRNTFNLSLGADYFATDKLTLRGGLGYDETPIKNRYRNVQLPDNNRYVISFGGHFQASKTLGFDLGWMHLFFNQARVSPPPLETGDQVVITNGHVSGGADVYGGQVTWNLT